jgi:capsular exopolysaccharide synthesis family protein
MASQDSTNKPLSLPRPFQQSGEFPAARSALALTGGAPPAGVDFGAAGQGLSGAPGLVPLLQALRRRWLLATTVALLGASAAAVGVWFILPPLYTASARLQVASRAPSRVLTHNEDETDFTLFKQNQVATITSAPVLTAALNKDEVKNLHLVRDQVNPISWLEKALKVDFLVSPEIMRVGLSGTEPDELAPLVNAVVDAYIQDIENKEKAKRSVLLAALKSNQVQEETKLRDRQKALRTMEQNLGLEDAATTQTKLTARLTELAQMKKEQRELQFKINDARGVSLVQIETHAKQDQSVMELVKRRGEVQKTIAEIRRTAQPHLQAELLDGPNRELEALNKAYAAVLRDLRPSIEKELRAQGDTAVAQLQRQEAALLADIGRLEEETKRIKRASVEVESARRTIDQTETALNELGKQIATLVVEPALGKRVMKTQDADTPRTRDLTRSALFAGAGGVGVFGLLLFGVALLEYRVRRINAVDEVVHGLGLPLVGTLPALPARARRPLPSGAEGKDLLWQSVMNEAVDAIRTLILHAARSETLQVVMVTSASGGEGKTSVASHLAASLARAWRKTLLVDGDLRNPAAHHLFDLPLEPGLSEVLRGEVTLADAIRPTPLSRLWLMPAGNCDSHAVQALAQEGVKAQFAQLKQQYDFIIVDSCPVLPVADSLLLGQHVDAVVFSILRDVSRMPAVNAAQKRLSALGIRTLGAVVIGASGDAGSTRYEYPGMASR